MLKLRRFKKEYNHNEVLDMVRKHEVSLHREMKLEAYYKNNNVINRTVKADGKANHKVAHPFCHQIVSTMVGYFASEPVQFDIENEQVKQVIKVGFVETKNGVNIYRVLENQNATGVAIAAGVARKPGQTRLELAKVNVSIVQSITENIMKYAKNPLILVVSNPADITTLAVQKASGLSPERVIGSGTSLDTARFRYLLSKKLQVNIEDIDAYVIENKQDNKNVVTFVKDYRIDLKQPAAFTLLVTRIDVPEGFLIDGGVDSEGRSYKKLHIDGYETRNMILIDGDTYVKPSDFTRVPYKAELDMVLSFRNIVAQSATLSLNVDESLPDMEINLPELPELLTGNGVVMDLYDPAMYMNFRNLSPLELNVYAHLYSYRNSQMLMDMHFGENGEDKPIAVPRQFDGSIGVSRRGEGEMMANPGLGMLFRTIPDMVQIKDIRLIASRDYASIVAGQEVEFSFGYELDAPLAFGPDLAMDLEYELAGFQLSINDVNVKKAVLTLDAVNSIPLSLNVTAVVLDSEGMPVNDMEITIDNEIKAGSVQSPTESSVTLTLTSEAEYLNLDGLRLCFRATCPPECQGIVLNENQTLELKEIKIFLPEGASVDVSDYIYAI